MDPRFKFIRGTAFQGLSDYLESKALKVKKRKIIYPIKLNSEQIDLLEGRVIIQHPEYGLRVRSGHFYELLSQSIWGGRVKEIYQIEGNPNGSLIDTEPDVSNRIKYILKEIKSMDSKGIVKLNDLQIFKYFLMQTGKFFKKTPTISFDIYRYGFTNLQSKYNIKKLEELIKDLSENTKFMISLPFSFIFKIYQNENEFTSRYEGKAAQHHTRFLSKGINELLAYPEYTMEKMNINPENYIIEKRKLSKKLYMNDIKLNSFPILLIKDNLSQDEIKNNLIQEVELNKILSERFKKLEIEYRLEEELKTDPNQISLPLIDEVPF